MNRRALVLVGLLALGALVVALSELIAPTDERAACGAVGGSLVARRCVP